MQNFDVEIRSDGNALVRLLVADRAINTITLGVIRDLERLVARIVEDSGIQSVVLTSGRENGFCAGADLREMSDNIRLWRRAASQVELAAALEQCGALGRQLRALETCGKPIVAAINGLALGGGFELLLACHIRIAAGDPKIRFAFPESGLGLLPGAGGTQRLLRLIGITKSLPYLLDGKSMPVAEAELLGIVDAVVASDQLLEATRDHASRLKEPTARWDRKGYSLPGGSIYSPAVYQEFSIAVGLLRKKTAGNYPARDNILKSVYEGSLVGIDAALRIESRYFLNTVRSAQAAAMVRSFWSMQELGKGGTGPQGHPRFKARRGAVLGAGMMGAGIAHAQALAGIATVLVDVDLPSAERGKAHVSDLLDLAVLAGRMSAEKAASTLALITPSGDYSEIRDVDIVVEAVFENRSLKAHVTRQAEPGLNPDGIFASNTSTLPIDGLASAAQRPESFIGIHFFSPVDRMALVEIIVGVRTSQETLAKAVNFVRTLKKTPIVVRDSRGFYTSRTFNTYVSEGLRMLEEGIAPALIDNIGRMTSMPRGPLELADDVSLDLLLAVEMQRAEDLGLAFPVHPEQRLLDTLVGVHDRKGRKNGKGIYDYPAGGGQKRLWSGIAQLAPVRMEEADSAQISDIRDRLLYRQALEAARCMEEGVISDARQADVGALIGWGFASWTGGPLSLIDMIGQQKFVARARALAARHGPQFEPPQLLLDMAARGQQFYDVDAAAK